jgi:phage terminase large subunit-like protein
MRAVLNGMVPAGTLVRLAVARQKEDIEQAAERGLRYDAAKAQHAVDFFGFVKHSKGEWAGQPFILSPWQEFVIRCLFGWVRADGFRRFRTAYIEVPRKNGKSTLAAGLGLYLLCADGEPGAEVYSAATKRDQAKISWGEAVHMVRASPALSRMVRHFKASDNLSIEATASKFMPLGADSDTMDGLNVHAALIDELHAHRTSAVVDVLQTATGSRRQPLMVEITTAGSDQSSICYAHHRYSEQVLRGTVVDDTWFGFIAALDEGDDWSNPEVWAKANPNYGISVKPDDLRRKADQARHMPQQQNAFRRLHLDQWTQQTDRWIDLALWDENAGTVDEEALKGQLCYGGLDLSSVSDLTAWVLAFPSDDTPDDLQVVTRFWCPEAKLHDDSNPYAEQYRAWARAGWLKTTPGVAMDYGFVKKAILEDAKKFWLVNLNVDRLFQGYQLSQELADEGLEVFGMGQGFLSMAAPMREFERRLLGRHLHHGNNPVLRWMADNVAVRMDPAGNIKPDKSHSQGKIDGIVALVMALDRVMRHETPQKSVYETRGLVTATGGQSVQAKPGRQTGKPK